MEERIIEAKAETLKDARSQAWLQVPDGFFPVAEDVVAAGSAEAETIQASDDTVKDAWSKAEAGVPKGVEVVERSVISEPMCRKVPVRASSEEEASAIAQKESSGSENVARVVLAEPARKGFLGLGSKEPLFEVEFRRPARVKIAYRTPAHVRLRMVDPDVCKTEKEYHSTQFNVSLKHPTDWQVIFENQDEAPWWKVVGLGGPRGSGGRPGLIVSLSSLLEGGNLQSYMSKAISDLRQMFAGLEVRTAELTRFSGHPTAWMRYTYRAKVGLMEELNVNMEFGTKRTILLQMICEAPTGVFEEMLQTFARMALSLRIEVGGIWLPWVHAVGSIQCPRCKRDLQDDMTRITVFDLDLGDLTIVCDDCKGKPTPKPIRTCSKCGRPIMPGERTGTILDVDSGSGSRIVCSDCFTKCMFG